MRMTIHLCPRKQNCLRISISRYLFNLRSARITQADRARNFVKRLAGCVVPRAPENIKHTVITH